MKISNINLNSFLHFGYFLQYKNPDYSVDFSNIDKEKYNNVDENSLIKTGGEILKSCTHSLFDNSRKHVIPLSGGMDSRAILAMLMEMTDASSIQTYTFGTPGTFDYDIGNFLAKKYGTRHHSYDLTKFEFSDDELYDIAQRIDHQSPLFLHPPIWDMENRYKDCIIWSGANAGAVVGSFYREDSAKTYTEAQKRFIDRAGFVKSCKLYSGASEQFIELMNEDYFSSDLLTFDEQVFFQERSIKHLAPHVLMKGFNYLLPFINNAFMDFMLSVPTPHRIRKSLYKKILFDIYPDIFSLRSEANYGFSGNTPKLIVKAEIYKQKVLSRIFKHFPMLSFGVNPMINYLDWEKSFREENKMKEFALRQITKLTNRNIVTEIDIMNIWDQHQQKKVNHADAILILLSLETHLVTGKKLNIDI